MEIIWWVFIYKMNKNKKIDVSPGVSYFYVTFVMVLIDF